LYFYILMRLLYPFIEKPIFSSLLYLNFHHLIISGPSLRSSTTPLPKNLGSIKKNDKRGKINPITFFHGQYIGWKCTIKLPRIEKLYIINHNLLLFSIFFLFASVCIKFVTGMHMVTLLQWLGGHMYNPQKHTSVHLCNCMPAQQSSCIFVSSTF
jgi:hypothetical protein